MNATEPVTTTGQYAEILTPKEAAEYLHIGVATLLRRARRGEIQAATAVHAEWIESLLENK